MSEYKPDMRYLCHASFSAIEEMVGVIQKEMEEVAFVSSDYETLRIEYNFLGKLLQRVKNEADQYDQ